MITQEQRSALAGLAAAGSIEGAIAVPLPDRTKVVVWGRDAVASTMEQAFAGLEPDERRSAALVDLEGPPRPGVHAGSRTDRAVALLGRHPGMTPHEAAVRIGISPSAVYRALKRSRRPCCPACKRPLS